MTRSGRRPPRSMVSAREASRAQRMSGSLSISVSTLRRPSTTSGWSSTIITCMDVSRNRATDGFYMLQCLQFCCDAMENMS